MLRHISVYWPSLVADIRFFALAVAAFAFATGAYLLYLRATVERPLRGFPVVTLPGLDPRQSWYKDGTATITKGVRDHDAPFQVITGTGPKIVLPNRFADDIRNREELSFNKAHIKDFFSNYPGFEPHKFGLTDGSVIAETVRVKLTQSLNLVTADLVDETTSALQDIFGEDKEWHEALLKQHVLDLVARLTSRVFLGKPLCRNERWLEIAKSFTVDSFLAANRMRMVPALVRPFCYWFLDECTRIRAQIRDARSLIAPEIEIRKERTQKALAAGEKPPKMADTIGWMYQVAQGKDIDYVSGQLALTLAAMHTTTEAMTHALVDLIKHPELIDLLREEVITITKANGWNKAMLQKLCLMDSFLKESQRLHPSDSSTMNRYVERAVQLSDGTHLPAGSRILVAGVYQDPSIYERPDTFDAYRFLKMSQAPGQVNSSAYVSTSARHMGFGHGQHACPGRFFASNELKVALCQMLLMYDLKAIEGQEPQIHAFETARCVDPGCKVLLKKRAGHITINTEC